MIENMVSETKRVFEGTTQENHWLFKYDALSLMTSKETSKRTKEKGYEAIWISPEMNLFTINPFLKHHIGRPPGNNPEL